MPGVARSPIADHDPGTAWFFDRAQALTRAGAATEVAMIEQSAAQRAMPPLHRRDEDETYRVLDGEVTFFVGDDVFTASAGEVVVAPRGSARTFRVESDGARWLVLTRVRSLERYRDFARAVTVPIDSDDWPSTAELLSVAALARANDIELIAPPGALPVAG